MSTYEDSDLKTLQRALAIMRAHGDHSPATELAETLGIDEGIEEFRP